MIDFGICCGNACIFSIIDIQTSFLLLFHLSLHLEVFCPHVHDTEEPITQSSIEVMCMGGVMCFLSRSFQTQFWNGVARMPENLTKTCSLCGQADHNVSTCRLPGAKAHRAMQAQLRVSQKRGTSRVRRGAAPAATRARKNSLKKAAHGVL